MGAVNWFRKTALPGALSEGEIHHVLPAGQSAHIQYVVNNSGVAIPPAVLAHGHAISDIVGLQTALNGKAGVVTLTAGAGLTGGGDTSTNRSFAFDTTWGDARYITASGGKYVSLNPNNGSIVDLVSGVDIDAINKTSRFYSTNGTTYPAGTAFGFVDTMVSSTDFFQTFVAQNIADAFYYRVRNQATIRPWFQVASRSWVTGLGYTSNAGTVTQVGITVPTGFNVTSSPVTGSGNVSFELASGYAMMTTESKAAWDQAYFWGNHASAGYVPGGRTITINGVTQNLTANRSWTVASGVTQVGLVVPTGFNVTSTPVTGTGNLSFEIASGYAMMTTESKNAWDVAYGWGNHATAGYMSNSRTITINGWTQNLRDNPSYDVIGYNATITINGVTQNLRDNPTFGISGGLSGSGSNNRLAKWNNGSVTDSRIYDAGSGTLEINAPVSMQSLVVNGTINATSAVKVGSGALSASAAFHVDSSSKGVILCPMTEAEMAAIQNPANNLLVSVSGGTGQGLWMYHAGKGWRIFATRVWSEGGGAP